MAAFGDAAAAAILLLHSCGAFTHEEADGWRVNRVGAFNDALYAPEIIMIFFII